MAMHLPIGYELKFNNRPGVYTVVKVLGRGASTIAYLTSYDNGAGRLSDRIIKEFCPQSIPIERDAFGSLTIDASHHEEYARSLKLFEAGGNRQNELRNKTRLRNETPPLLEILYSNNTAYLEVTPFEGRTYDNLSSFTLLERIKICLTVAKLVKQYHTEGYLCLDIKPDNIFVLTNSSNEVVTDLIEFIDFDSVRKKTEIGFGNSLSFTEAWAAPEQISVHSVRRISEATDVYTIGELVFWSIFERHSSDDEHRSFSRYSFENSPEAFAEQVGRYDVQVLLSKLFQKTLRSSSRNRFQTMQPVVELLEAITEKLAKKEYIIAQNIVPKEFFLGRNQEFEALNHALETDKVVFITGLAGIGKSELVKRFAHDNRTKYDSILYWTYDGSLATMLCDESAVSISSFLRHPDEEDENYAKRKLLRLSSLLTPRSLIIIDNVNILVSEFDSPAIWAQILSLPGKTIISTRCYETEFRCVEVNEISDINLLRKLFLKHCPSAADNESQYGSIDRIISIAGKHTYEIELLAVYTEENMQTPEITLLEMEQEGFSSLTGTSLSVQKDGNYSGATFMEHLEKLLSMSQLSESLRLLLLKLSLMPAAGISLKDIKEFYGIHDVHDLRWLIKHGFVTDTGRNSHILAVHPAVADAVVSAEKRHDIIWEQFYQDALTAMRRGYDDPSVNQSFYEAVNEYLDSRQFIDSLSSKTKEEIPKTIENLRKHFASQYARSDVSSAAYSQLCCAVAEKTVSFKLQHKLAAQYTTQYVEWFSKFGHYNKQLAIIQYALHLYQKQNSRSYCPDREYAYAVYVDLSVSLGKEYTSMIGLCKEHLLLARKAKDWHMASYWCLSLAKLCFLITDYSSIKYQFLNVYYSLRRLWQKKSLHGKFANSFTPNTTKIGIRSAELNESMYEFYPPSDPGIMKWNLQRAILEREKALDPNMPIGSSSNSVMIAIDRARISILDTDFNTAIHFLTVALEPYISGRYSYSVATKHAAELLGDVYTTTGDYQSAIDLYLTALQIADQVGEINPYAIRIKLGRAYNLSGSEKAKQHNDTTWEEIKEISSDNFQRYVADAGYNVGDYNYSVGNIEVSERFIRDALAIYESCTHHRLHNNIGRARCYERLAKIHHIRGEASKAKEFAEKAATLSVEMFGANHPEAKEFKLFRSTLE